MTTATLTELQTERTRLKAVEAERELAEERKRGFDVVKLRNELVEKAAKDEEKKVSELAKIHEEWAKAIQRQTDLQRKNSQEYLDGIDKQIFAASAMVQAAQDEYDTYGMSASQIAKLTLVRLEDARAVQLLTALTFEDLRAIDAHEQQIAQLGQGLVTDALLTVMDMRAAARAPVAIVSTSSRPGECCGTSLAWTMKPRARSRAVRARAASMLCAVDCGGDPSGRSSVTPYLSR